MTTAIVGGILLVIVIAIIRSLVKGKKNGKHICGGDCAHCKGCQH